MRNKRTGPISQFFNKPINLKYNVKRVYISHLSLVGIPSLLIISVRNRKGGGFLFNEKKLSVPKVICQWSLVALRKLLRNLGS